jgi:gamma-glutamyltranspeptidase/glutathione hydrolase
VYMHKGVVVTGNSQTTAAAVEILRDGGNAYDAILAALLITPLTEPVLSSLAGGGHMLSYQADGTAQLYDFFTHTPYSRKLDTETVDFYPATVDFGATKQDFHIGMGSIAVPGVVRGLFEIHRERGSLPMRRIIEPAVRGAREGVIIDDFQSGIIDLVEPIFRATPEAEKQYTSPTKEGALLRSGDLYVNTDYAQVLELLAKEGDEAFYSGDIAHQIIKDVRRGGGYLTIKDLEQYEVIRRDPLFVSYRNSEFITNPPPSSGGILIAFALKMLEKFSVQEAVRNSTYLELLTFVMEATNKARADKLNGNLFDPRIAESFLDPELVSRYVQEVSGKTNYLGGTTQLSVIDHQGNAASMTVSAGEGSGYIVPGTGIMMNNMLGEEDLHPNGFHLWHENERISSMMSPSLLKLENGTIVALGSGGSNRIRTAILQVVINMVDRGMCVEEAVRAPRIHFERDELNVEPGFDPQDLVVLDAHFDGATFWEKQSMFFGGVHAAVHDPSNNTFYGGGDPRRGGSSEFV